MKRIKYLLFFVFGLSVLSYGQFKQAALPYDYNALEPYIDSSTMYIHYNFHHASYLKNFNKALEKYPELYKKDVVEILKNINELPIEIQTAVRNNGGGYYNHSLYWTIMAPACSTKMSSKLEKILIKNFGSIDAFKSEFENAAMTRFGSGWAWLIKEPSGKLTVYSTANQDNCYNPDSKIKGTPVLTLDIWEHAYYLNYQNKRADYVKSFWNIVNWNEVEKLLEL